MNWFCGFCVLLTALLSDAVAAEKAVVRFGHFPNVTHVQALVARSMARDGNGWFESRLGKDVEIQWFVYNAGPSAMEAIFANSLDLTYVGPSPALNAYARSQGAEIRLLAGAVDGGAALVVQPDAGLKQPIDFKGRKIATPQLGNTQDVACRAWLAAGGLKITQLGGDAQVLPTANPDQLALFQQKKVDAVWTVEPWVSRLVSEASGSVLVEESDAITTILVARSQFLKERSNLVKQIAAAHRELTAWIKEHPEEAQKRIASELAEQTKAKISPGLVEAASKRILLTTEVKRESLDGYVNKAKSVGFLRDIPDLGKMFESYQGNH